MDEGDPITVVHAVMRPDLPQQWVLVETSLTGSFEAEEETGSVPGGVERPVTGARVHVANISFGADPCGPQVIFDAQPENAEDETAGVYWSPAGCPTMRPGDTLELRVETPGGPVVTGRTEVPGINGVTLRAGGREEIMPGPLFSFNRDTDTLVADVDPAAGRALQIEVGERRSVRSSWFFVDSTSVTLPGTIPDFFDRDFDLDGDVPDLFLAGVYYEFTTAWTDQNYFDFVRSMNSPLSGRGFINELNGGMGLFGSLVAVTNELRVTGNTDDPIEGRYELSGILSGIPVEITWELYASAGVPRRLAGFVTGQWVFGNLDDYVIGGIDPTNRFQVFLSQASGDDGHPGPFLLRGQLSTGGPFAVTVEFGQDVDTIEGRRISP